MNPMQFERIRSTVAQVSFPPWRILLMRSKSSGHPYLQVHNPSGTCNQTGEPKGWSGRKWMLSEHMSDTEVVKTALLAVLAAVQHETLENFRFKGRTIFNPHTSIDALLYANGKFELDGRPPPKSFECDKYGHAFVQTEMGLHDNGTLRYTLSTCSRCGVAHKKWYDRDERPTPGP